MRMRLFFVLLLSGSVCATNAQDTTPTVRRALPEYTGTPAKVVPVDTPTTSGVVIMEEPAVTKLMADYSTRKHVLKGYRVQIFLGTDRSQGENLRRSFLLKHPGSTAYLSFLAPNFRVRAGDFRDRLAAEKLLRDLREEFPGSYVVPDEIELPTLPDGK